MYLRIGVVEAAERTAIAFAQVDRERYRPFLEAAERFAASSGLIACGQGAATMLMGTTRASAQAPSQAPAHDLQDYHYDFYSSRGFMVAKELADIIYDADPEGLGHYTTLITNIPHHNWKIMVDGRPMFTITAISPQLRSMCSVQRPARFDSAINLAVIRPELALLDIYRDLCDPTQLGEIGNLLTLESKLRSEFLQRLPVGLRENRAVSGPTLARPIAEYRTRLLKEFVPGPGRLLIGAAALRLEGSDTLQVVSAEAFDAEAEAVALIGKGLGLSVAAHTAAMNLPGDVRLQRLTLTVASTQNPVVIMEIYNLALYELVPYVNRGPLRVGSPFVILRFLLMQLWMLRSRNRDLRHIVSLVQLATRLLKAPPEDVLPINYIGRVEDSEVAFKREIQSAIKQLGADGRPRFYSQYMPAAVKKVNPNIKAAASGITPRDQPATDDTKMFEPLPWEDM